ncbi:MAG: cytochrome C, partial [Opitutaceae bacterium]
PFNKGGGPVFWPQSNVKLSLQYTAYGKFDGAHTNYDGSGRSARDNNTLYLEAWIVF